MKFLLTWKTEGVLVTSRTIVTVGTAVTKVASSYYIQSPRTVAVCTAAASTGSYSTDNLGEESLVIDYIVRIDSALAGAHDRAAEGGQYNKATERTRRIGIRREGSSRVVAF
jgi:hypothetical protein